MFHIMFILQIMSIIGSFFLSHYTIDYSFLINYTKNFIHTTNNLLFFSCLFFLIVFVFIFFDYILPYHKFVYHKHPYLPDFYKPREIFSSSRSTHLILFFPPPYNPVNFSNPEKTVINMNKVINDYYTLDFMMMKFLLDVFLIS